MSTNKNNDEETVPMLQIIDAEPFDAKTEHVDSITNPMFTIDDSEPFYATVTSFKTVHRSDTTDTNSEVKRTVLSYSPKPLTGTHQYSNENKMNDPVDVVADNKTREHANVVTEVSFTCATAVSYSVTTYETASSDVTKTKAGMSSDAANLTNEELETQCKGKSVPHKTESKVETKPKQVCSNKFQAGSVAARKDLTMNLDIISLSNTDASCESDITPPVTCFNWFKPQRIISKLRCKRYMSPVSDLPSLTSAVSDPRDLESEIQHGAFGAREALAALNSDIPSYLPETQPFVNESGKYHQVVLLGFIPSDSEESRLERIDYASLAEEKIIPTYLSCHPCYDVMPTSGKVIILSVELLVKNAFSALVTNDIKAAPLWDASVFDFVGMLTISDFINVLRHYYYSNAEDIKDIENQSIATWRRITEVKKSFVKVNSSDSLVQATKLLIQENVHRLPVFDEKRQSVLFVLTRKRLLHYLSNSLFDNFEKTNIKTPSFFRKTIGELKVGTFEDIATVNINTKVIDALDLFVKRNVSSLPVVDKDNVLLDIFEKFDVFQLAKEQTYHNLDMEINEAISKADVRETAWICTMNETFGTVINRFVNNKVHRIVVTDDDRAVIGIISLSDVLKFLCIDPLENSGLPSTAETIDETSEGAVGGSSLESSQKAASLDEEDASTVSEAVASLKIEDSKLE